MLQKVLWRIAQEESPNGLAFSPDEQFLYVTNWDAAKKVVMRYRVDTHGDLTTSEVFFDLGAAPEPEAVDGIKVDVRGISTSPGPADCGSSRRQARTWARSARPSCRRTSPLATPTDACST